MSATTAPFRPASAAASTITTTGLVRSEWIKMRSLRSTFWAYAATIVAGIGFSLLFALAVSSGDGGAMGTGAGIALGTSTLGLTFAQLPIAVLGVLVISGEYSTGMIRSTLTAVPKRLPALWAKAAVFAVVTFVVGLVLTFGSYFATAPILAGKGISSSITDPGLAVGLAGGALFLALVGVISLGIGTMLRSSAGGIAGAIGLLLLAPIVLGLIGAEWSRVVVDYLPTSAGQSLYTLATGQNGLVFEPWQAILVLLGWTVVTLGGGALLLSRRDA